MMNGICRLDEAHANDGKLVAAWAMLTLLF